MTTLSRRHLFGLIAGAAVAPLLPALAKVAPTGALIDGSVSSALGWSPSPVQFDNSVFWMGENGALHQAFDVGPTMWKASAQPH